MQFMQNTTKYYTYTHTFTHFLTVYLSSQNITLFVFSHQQIHLGEQALTGRGRWPLARPGIIQAAQPPQPKTPSSEYLLFKFTRLLLQIVLLCIIN